MSKNKSEQNLYRDVSKPVDECTVRQGQEYAERRGHEEYDDGDPKTNYHSTKIFGNNGKPIE